MGDAYSPQAALALQAKRYTVARISENEVEGDIDRILREAPALDVLVVATTKDSAQLAARLSHKTRETGLDLLLLALGDDSSPFNALCIAHWDVVREFLADTGVELQTWASVEARKKRNKAALRTLRESLLGLATRQFLSEQSFKQNAQRFCGQGIGARTHNCIALNDAIERPDIETLLSNWWEDKNTPIAVLEGEEGMGKTWVAAAFAESLSKTEAPIVFWLDSMAWMQTGEIETLVSTALAEIFIANDVLRARIKRKLFHQWQQPVLLVLDGANERGAWKAAERVLRDYARHIDILRPRVRLLFTSRPLSSRPGVRHDFWAGCRVIPVGPFNDSEFRAALAKAALAATVEAFPDAVHKLAVVPRYFRLCVRLRKRLTSLQHLNKQVLLWADLQEKLTSGDPQLATLGEELNDSPEGILANLARLAGWPSGEKPSVATEELQRSFPNFWRVRSDLVEQHIVFDSDFSITTLSADHVVLGWALMLRQLAKRHATEDPEQLSDRIGRVLEPAASNDDKVRAVHIATLLTFLEEPQDVVDLGNARTALLGLWVGSHNAAINVETLQFFVRSDIVAYARVVEENFRNHLPGDFECALIAPLAVSWRDDPDNGRSLREVLERWLRLVYPGDASGSENGKESPPARFAVAKSPEQLRLSFAAISVISFNPRIEMLPALLDCYCSTDFCYEVSNVNKGRNRFPIKNSAEPLGVLLRWSYTEAIVPQLRALVTAAISQSKELETALWFARLLRMAELPREFGAAEDIHISGSWSPSRQVNNFRQFLRKTSMQEGRALGVASLESLAVRRDLLSLEEADVQALCTEVHQRVTSSAFEATHPGTWEHRQLQDLLPWLARYAPVEFEATCRALWLCAIESNDPVPRLMDLDEFMPASDPGGQLVQTTLDKADVLLAQKHFEAAVVPLTELLLLHGSQDQIIKWLRLVQDKIIPRGGSPIINILPLPIAFEKLTLDGLAERARQEFDQAFAACKSNPTKETLRHRARHWLHVYSYACKPTKEVGEWALALASELESDDEFGFPLFRLLTGCNDLNILRRALEHPTMRKYQLGRNAWRWGCCISRDMVSLPSFEELKQHTSFTVSGWLLWRSERHDELRKWGGALAQSALSALDMDTTHFTPQTNLEFRVDKSGNFAGIGFESLHDGSLASRGVSSPVWGIERHVKRPAPSQADADATCDRFYSDMQRLRASPRREFVGFNAAAPLFHWSRLEPEVFIPFAEQFLERLWEKDLQQFIDLSFLATTVVIALLRLKPDSALRFCECRKSCFRLRVFDFESALSWATEALWSSELNGSVEVVSQRRRLLNDAANDEELLWHSLAAHAGGNALEVARFADEHLAKPAARDRALGVSLLAFQGDDASLAKLAVRRESDVSFWVREHATWAWEVCALEQACRRRYREALQAGSLSELAVGLAELRQAFTPMVHAWRQDVEREAGWPQCGSRMNGYLDVFWYHWGNTSLRKENIKLLDRKLRDFCRGECIEEGVTTRQAPWWRLEEM